ncbi:MAG: hypothetical protein Q7R88_01130, partial [bacterium]|nr:hypothetical protein [bacterium]
WMGIPNPPPPNELGYGNRVHFSLYTSSSVAFRLNDLTAFQIRGSDTNNALRFEGNLTTNTYSPTRVGIWWGFDGVQGTADDVIRTAGPGTGLINELVFIGVANAFVANSAQVLDQIVQYIEQSQPFTVTGEYAVRIGDTTHRPSRTLPFFSTGAQDIRLGISRQSNFRLITLTGPPGTYFVERSMDLLQWPWSVVSTVTVSNETPHYVTDSTLTPGSGFFRARRQ